MLAAAPVTIDRRVGRGGLLEIALGIAVVTATTVLGAVTLCGSAAGVNAR
jgi:hypothetical protein